MSKEKDYLALFQFLPVGFQCLKCGKNLECESIESLEEPEEERTILICECFEKREVMDFLVRAKKFGILNPWIKWEMRQYNIQPSEEKRNEAIAGMAY